MNEQKNNGRGIFYGVIGVATLVVAIIGATFAYFTATASNNNVITGNMATINFGLSVKKVTNADELRKGMIPMSNNMVEAAVSKQSNGACLDDNGNAVCQVYEITVTNTGTASLFLDGYVTLTGGSGVPTDVIVDDATTTGTNESEWVNVTAGTETTMRWAQVFPDTSGENVMYTTKGKTTTGATTTAGNTIGIDTDWSTIAAMDTVDQSGNVTAKNSYNTSNLLFSSSDANNQSKTISELSDIVTKGKISGNEYDIINRNFIRISDHKAGESYDRSTDITSALVFNQYLDAASTQINTDEATFYFVVWLGETGKDQTATTTGAGTPENSGLKFFNGNVTFNSAQGSEVTATFSGYVAVESDNV